MYISEYMTANPITVSGHVSLPEARKILSEYRIRHLPVIDGEDRLVGILTDRDLRSAYPSSVTSKQEAILAFERVQSSTVEDIMTTECSTLGENARLDDALLIFERDKVGAIPVIDESEKVVGLFSLLDLTTAYGKLFGVVVLETLYFGVEDDGRKNIFTELAAVFESNDIAPMSMVRIREGKDAAKIYLRVHSLDSERIVQLLREKDFQLLGS